MSRALVAGVIFIPRERRRCRREVTEGGTVQRHARAAMNEDAVQREIATAVEVHRHAHGRRDPSGENALIARISTHEERNEANADQTSTSLIESAQARDTILFYGRQDSAHALLNTVSLLGEIVGLRRQMRVLIGLVVLLLVGLVALCGLLWAGVSHGVFSGR